MIFIHKTRDILNLNEFNTQAKALNSKIDVVMKFGNDDLRFTLNDTLTAQEESDLDDLVTNFVDTDLSLKVPKIISICKMEAAKKHFHNIDYKKELTQSLIPKRTVSQGEVVKVEWFKSLDGNMQPIDKVINVDIVYNRDATGFATSRTTTRTWINEDETDNSDVKVTHKYYFVNPSDMIDEGLKRRKLLINSIQIPVMTFMTEVLMPLGFSQEAVVLKGREFMDDYETDFNKFVENSSSITNPADPNFGKKSIVVEFEDNDPAGRNANYNSWLDAAPASLGGLTTIRQYLISEFSI